MGRVSFQLFGRFSAMYDDLPLEGLQNTKAQELVSYLLLGARHGYHREMLADVLWSHMPTSQPRKYLRQSLWQVQNALRPTEGQGSGGVLIVEPDWIRLNANADVWADVTEFASAMTMVQEVPGKDLTPEHAGIARSAIELYTGDLLEGWYQDWCLEERQRMRTNYMILLEKLMDYCEAHRLYERGIDYGLRILRIDRSHERTHRNLMRMHHLMGDRTAAFRQYQRCQSALLEDFGIRPSKDTEELLSRVTEPAPQPLDVIEDSVSQDITAQLSSLREKLWQAQTLLGELDHLVQHHISDTTSPINHGGGMPQSTIHGESGSS